MGLLQPTNEISQSKLSLILLISQKINQNPMNYVLNKPESIDASPTRSNYSNNRINGLNNLQNDLRFNSNRNYHFSVDLNSD
jgi:hypothetical protein